MREAWEADRDRRFTFARLNELVLKAKRGEEFRGALAGILPPIDEPSSAAGPMPPPRPEGGPRKMDTRRLGPRGAERMAKALAAAGEERLRTDDRALLLLEVLSAVAGKPQQASSKRGSVPCFATSAWRAANEPGPKREDEGSSDVRRTSGAMRSGGFSEYESRRKLRWRWVTGPPAGRRRL